MSDVEAPREPRTEYQRALDSLTRYLAARDHSRAELKQKLERKYDPAVVARLLDEAEGNGWLLPEDQMAERAARTLQRKHKSASYIRASLRKRGLPVTPAANDADAELESARALVARKFGEGPLDYETRGKAMRFLQYRGFSPRAIRAATTPRED